MADPRDLPPTEFSNAMNDIGRPVGTEYRATPEWQIFLAGRMAESRRQHEDLAAAKDGIRRLQKEAMELDDPRYRNYSPIPGTAIAVRT
jgi:hypothetical protein